MANEPTWSWPAKVLAFTSSICVVNVLLGTALQPMMTMSDDEWKEMVDDFMFKAIFFSFAFFAVAFMFFCAVVTKPDNSIEARLARVERVCS